MMKTESAHKGLIISMPGIEGLDALISCIKLASLQSRDKALLNLECVYFHKRNLDAVICIKGCEDVII